MWTNVKLRVIDQHGSDVTYWQQVRYDSLAEEIAEFESDGQFSVVEAKYV